MYVTKFGSNDENICALENVAYFEMSVLNITCT
jgi:hypothetical protein